MRHHMRVRFDPFEKPELFEPRDDQLARREAFVAVQFLGKHQRALGQIAQIIFVAGERQTALLIEHADLRQSVALADLEIVEVMRRRDLHRAGAFFRIGIFVGDDRNFSPDQRQDHVLADQVGVALIVRMHGHRGVAQHRLRPRGGDDDEGRGIVRIEALAFQRIAQIPQAALDLDLLHFEIGDRGQQLRIPVHQPLVLVDQPLAMQCDEHFHHRARQALVHRKAFARPVAGRAQPLQLVDDDAAAFGLPLPHAFEKFGAAHLAAAGLLPLHQLPLDHHLGGDAGVIGAGLPQHVAAAHPLEPAQHVLQRVVERVPHVQRSRDVRRRDHDGERFCVAALRAAGLERAGVFPEAGHAGFDFGGLVGLLDHGR